MASNIISFRLSDSELELLGRQKQQGESLSLCAARLLRERLGIVNNLLTSEFTTIDDLINDKLAELEPRLNASINVALSDIEARLKALELVSRTNVKKATSTTRRKKSVSGD